MRALCKTARTSRPDHLGGGSAHPAGCVLVARRRRTAGAGLVDRGRPIIIVTGRRGAGSYSQVADEGVRTLRTLLPGWANSDGDNVMMMQQALRIFWTRAKRSICCHLRSRASAFETSTQFQSMDPSTILSVICMYGTRRFTDRI
jgi:hypothetical protein